MKIILIAIFIVCIYDVLGYPTRQTTTPQSDHEETDEESFEEMMNIADLIPDPMPRERASIVLQRALEILNKKKSTLTRRQMATCEGSNIDQEAKNILHMMTGEKGIGSTSEESGSSSQQTQDSDFCIAEEMMINGTERIISLETMKIILKLHDEKQQSEKSIKGKYKWFDRSYIARFRDYLERSGTTRSKSVQVDELVWSRARQAIEAQQPLHDYHSHRWGLEVANQIGAASFLAGPTWIRDFKIRHGIVSRKVTDYGSRAETAQLEEIERSIESFHRSYNNVRIVPLSSDRERRSIVIQL